MLRRVIWLLASLVLACAAIGFSGGSGSAQTGPDAPVCSPDGSCSSPGNPGCAPDGACIDEPAPPPVCPDGQPCGEPEPCTPETCAGPCASDTVICDPGCLLPQTEPDITIDIATRLEAADEEAKPEIAPCVQDTDGDAHMDVEETSLGSDPNRAASTPEHNSIAGTCADAVDNDTDGATDSADPGCAPDADSDVVPDASDNCAQVWNQDQTDTDGDGIGDACEDSDADGVLDAGESMYGSDPNNAASVPEMYGFVSCIDGLDNDTDGAIDAADPTCSGSIAMPLAEDGNPAASFARDLAADAAQPAALPNAGAGISDADPSARDLSIIAAGLVALSAILGFAAWRLPRHATH